MTHAVDQEARDMAVAAKNAISSHERVCAERWNAANEKLDLIVKILGWGGGTLIVALLAAVGLR